MNSFCGLTPAAKCCHHFAAEQSIGFTELETGDVWPHPHAVVSDGDICIGLHDRELEAPALSFVQQDLARHSRSMMDHGFNFSFLNVDEDVFNELGFKDRDGNMVTLVEARTFSPAPDNLQDSICGSWFELTLPARDAMATPDDVEAVEDLIRHNTAQ